MPRTLSPLSMQMDRVDKHEQRYLAIAALAALVTLAPNMIAAQPVFVPSASLPKLTQDDIARMHAAAARLYEGQSRLVGSSERWGVDSNDAGEVKLVRSFNVNGIPCRTIDYIIQVAGVEDGEEHYVVNCCQLYDKGWKIVEDTSRRALNEHR